MRKIIIRSLILLAGCSHPPVSTPPPVVPTIDLGERVELYSTIYYTPTFTAKTSGVPIRDINNKILSYLTSKDFCALAMEGSGYLGNKLYNYLKQGSYKETNCSHNPSSYARFYVDTTHKYGVGNKSNPLIPFVSIACDQTRFKFGQRFYIPAAEGVFLPDGSRHDGVFRCDDTGGLIKGNHIDTFIGLTANWRETNPFLHITHTPTKTFMAYLITN